MYWDNTFQLINRKRNNGRYEDISSDMFEKFEKESNYKKNKSKEPLYNTFSFFMYTTAL